eukprot:CAMPEP_0119317856 /NCGR_PEP_ID=MMETSP1333-20130426/44587_1 /TAXON_ID=418940 /ORGANISM="Scyphosphaera apsteinii, Strain RCC1455" /LENGTH=97 /DNA_ID=CAMNT_0007323917 /DNA_START=236 /DNA_END=527 /DNA_ORIENTATION=+
MHSIFGGDSLGRRGAVKSAGAAHLILLATVLADICSRCPQESRSGNAVADEMFLLRYAPGLEFSSATGELHSSQPMGAVEGEVLGEAIGDARGLLPL